MHAPGGSGVRRAPEREGAGWTCLYGGRWRGYGTRLLRRLGGGGRRASCAPAEQGSAAVEFALILPVLILLLFGTIQFANVLFTRQAMIYAAREAARSYAVGESDVAGAGELALGLLSAASPSTFTVTVLEPADGGTDVTVAVSVPMAEAALVNVLGSLMSGTIEASVTMRVEGAA